MFPDRNRIIDQRARERGINLKASWMIGDSESDIEAGKRAVCTTVMLSGTGKRAGSDVVAPALQEAAQKILQREEVGTW